MRGTTPIVLCEPLPGEPDALGQRIPTFREHSVMAIREEFRGRVGLEADAIAATWDRSYSIRATSLRPKPRWRLRDTQDDLEFEIESVVRDQRRRLELRCVAVR
ncbi:MAG: hypothetical protein OXC93_05570 [Rhodospirillaceae bacterium]|nr:hypothetical protein [Rhodospirillaceae bacterium]